MSTHYATTFYDFEVWTTTGRVVVTDPDALEAATGHDSVHWFALLDAAGAVGLAHRPIVEILQKQGVPDWWCQSITVRYEQERGLRAPGQRADGTFQVNASCTLDGELADIYVATVAALGERGREVLLDAAIDVRQGSGQTGCHSPTLADGH